MCVAFATVFYGNDQPFTAPIIIPFVKYLWKNGYTRMIGVTTMMVTVIRTEVVVAACASVAAADAELPVLLITDFSELAELI